MSKREKLFVGRKLRQIRDDLHLNQTEFAEVMGLSASYVSQLEHDLRPVTANILIDLSTKLSVDVSKLSNDDTFKIASELKETIADPIYGQPALSLINAQSLVRSAPELANALLEGHRVIKQLEERLQIIDSSLGLVGSERQSYPGDRLPYDEVRDYFHDHDNYFDGLDRSAEQVATSFDIAGKAVLSRLIEYLAGNHEVIVHFDHRFAAEQVVLEQSANGSVLKLNGVLPAPTQAFQLAAQIGLREQRDAIERLLNEAAFRTPQARQICKLGLANYYAGALLMPYSRFVRSAESVRYDVDRLAVEYGTSFEQVCHRLSNLQRPRELSIPFFFVRMDQAGNITKRHSATEFQFARYGGSCPLWNIHESFRDSGKINVQFIETPDDRKYISVARAIEKPASHFRGPSRHYAVALGCEATYVDRLVYGDGLDPASNALVTRVGTSCRICPRKSCHHRAFPPIDRKLIVDESTKTVVPYDFE